MRIIRNKKILKKSFTLIEVMVAVTIATVALISLVSGASRCLTVIQRSKNYQKAQWILDAATVDFPIISNEVENSAINMVEYKGFFFEREIEPIEDGLYIIKSRVKWSPDKDSPCLEVSEYFYDYSYESKKKNQ